MERITVRSQLGDCAALTDGTVAAFDRWDAKAGRDIRHYVLLNEGVKLMYEPWGWKGEWYADLILIERPAHDLICLTDLCLDLVIQGNGPTYRLIDLGDFASVLASGRLRPEDLPEPLGQLQNFLDNHLHHRRDFPPKCIEQFMALPSIAAPSGANSRRRK